MSADSIQRHRTSGNGSEDPAPATVADPVTRLRVGSALRACQVAAERCGRALPKVSAHGDARVPALSDCLELCELCAQALGRALEGIDSPFLEDELALCTKVARACADALATDSSDESLESCARACIDCAEWCDRVLSLGADGDRRSAA